MDLDRIRLFVNVVNLGTLSSAASASHLSQPAATRAIQKLEEDLGAKLFVRKGRGLALTEGGRTFLPRAKQILTTLEIAERELEETRARGYYDVKIGTVDSIGTYVAPSVLSDLRRDYPELGIKLTTARTATLLDSLSRDLDLAIVASTGAPTDDAIRVGRYALEFYGSKREFKTLRNVVDEAELSEFPIVQIAPTPGQPTLVSKDAPSYALVQSLSCVKQLVLAGIGVGALLDFMLSASERKRLVCAGIEHDPNCAVWLCPGSRFNGERAEEIVEKISDSLRSFLAP